MCQKSALQCQLTCLYVLYTVNPSPLPPRSNTHCHESWENFLYKIYQVLGKLEATQWIRAGIVWVRSWVQSYYMLDFFLLIHFVKKDVVGITRHVVTAISAFSFTMMLIDRILTHIVNHLINTSYHLQYLYCQGGYVFGAKPNLITCVGYIFLSVVTGFLKKFPALFKIEIIESFLFASLKSLTY